VANKKASKKAILRSQKRMIENGIVRSKLNTLARQIRIGGGSSDSIQQAAIEYVSVFNKAANSNGIHSDFANRRKVTLQNIYLHKYIKIFSNPNPIQPSVVYCYVRERWFFSFRR
jgi:ribosomal protein S20